MRVVVFLGLCFIVKSLGLFPAEFYCIALQWWNAHVGGGGLSVLLYVFCARNESQQFTHTSERVCVLATDRCVFYRLCPGPTPTC